MNADHSSRAEVADEPPPPRRPDDVPSAPDASSRQPRDDRPGGPLVWVVLPVVAGWLGGKWVATQLSRGARLLVESFWIGLTEILQFVLRSLRRAVVVVHDGFVMLARALRGAVVAVARVAGRLLEPIERAIAIVAAAIGTRLGALTVAIGTLLRPPVAVLGRFLASAATRMLVVMRAAARPVRGAIRMLGELMTRISRSPAGRDAPSRAQHVRSRRPCARRRP